MYSQANNFVIDNLYFANRRANEDYLLDIKPEDRGLVIQNVTGNSNGLVVLIVKNFRNHSVVIKDVILKENGDNLEVKDQKIKKFSNTLMIILLVFGIQKDYCLVTHTKIEILTQRGSYIGAWSDNSYFLIKKIE